MVSGSVGRASDAPGCTAVLVAVTALLLGSFARLATIDPDNVKVAVKSWPIPQAFTAAGGALWNVTPNQQTLQKRSPSSLKILTSFGVGSATGGTAGTLWLTYGADFLWLEHVVHEPLEGTAAHGQATGRALAEIHRERRPSAG